jgi:serine/threonine-protein kinase HipA
LPSGSKPPEQNYSYRQLNEKDLYSLLKKLPLKPLMVAEEGVRMSLAGAQNKVALHVKEGLFSIPLESAPSTHIIKPAMERFKGTVYNEAFCLNLASIVGLPTARAHIGSVCTIEYLLVERYDRVLEKGGALVRLHQEDFCQASGLTSQLKYQKEGGPSLVQCFDLIRRCVRSPVTDLQRFLDAVIFNILIGNNDAHSKNFSLLYEKGSTSLAPLYDLLSTSYYPDVATTMAMKVGGEYNFEKLFPRHFEELAVDAKLNKELVKKRVVEMCNKVIVALDQVGVVHPNVQGLDAMIFSRATKFKERFV